MINLESVENWVLIHNLAKQPGVGEVVAVDLRPDQDGCVEIQVASWCDTKCGDKEPPAEDDAEERADLIAALSATGLEVVSISDVDWAGWSEWTPDPGDHRRVRVRVTEAALHLFVPPPPRLPASPPAEGAAPPPTAPPSTLPRMPPRPPSPPLLPSPPCFAI